MIEDIGHQSEGQSKPIPLDIKPLVLDKIIEWLKYHFDDPIDDNFDDEDIDSTKRTDDICEWDQKFFEVDRETLFDLIIAANFLDIKGLLEAGCKTAANQIKGKNAEEVRKLWNIECDLSPEEEERLKKENEWTEEK